MARFAALILALSAAMTVGVRAGALADKAAAAATRQESFVEGADGWRFLPADLRFVDKLTSPDLASIVSPAVGAVADFADQLRSAGISLAVLPVPPKALVLASSLGAGAVDREAMGAGWEKIMTELRSRGVPVIDLLPEYTAAEQNVFCRGDTHWSGHGIDRAVSRILEAGRNAGLAVQDVAETPLKEIEITGDLRGAPEKVELRFPPLPLGAPEPQLLLLGDSHVLVFHQGGDLHGTGAGLPEQLAAPLGFVPEVLGVRGSGATSSRVQLARRLKSKQDYLAQTKLVVWVFAGREFTEADMWKNVPVFPRKP